MTSAQTIMTQGRQPQPINVKGTMSKIILGIFANYYWPTVIGIANAVALSLLAQSAGIELWIILITFPIALIFSLAMIGTSFYFAQRSQRFEKRIRHMGDEIQALNSQIASNQNIAPISITGLQIKIGYLRLLQERFSQDELQDLIYVFGLQDKFDGLSTPDMARGFLVYITQHQKVRRFEEWVYKNRGDISLDEYQEY